MSYRKERDWLIGGLRGFNWRVCGTPEYRKYGYSCGWSSSWVVLAWAIGVVGPWGADSLFGANRFWYKDFD